MTLIERTRLASVLSLLGSPHAGERDAAALAADRLVRGRGLSWDQVLLEQPGPQLRTEHPLSDDLALCGRSLHLLSEWEADFVVGVARQRSITAKQSAVLAKIAVKVRTAA